MHAHALSMRFHCATAALPVPAPVFMFFSACANFGFHGPGVYLEYHTSGVKVLENRDNDGRRATGLGIKDNRKWEREDKGNMVLG